MYIMIDNYDSFVYNLDAYFKELGQEIEVIRNDAVDIHALLERGIFRESLFLRVPKIRRTAVNLPKSCALLPAECRFWGSAWGTRLSAMFLEQW